MGTSKRTPVCSIGRPELRACRKAGITTTGWWPRLTSSSGRLPQTSPRPPVLQKGTASVVANRIFTREFRFHVAGHPGRSSRAFQPESDGDVGNRPKWVGYVGDTETSI